MGQKGDKMTSASGITAELVTAKLETIDGLSMKKMFGGYGIFHDGSMFGLIDSKGKMFLKSNETIQSYFDALGSEQHSRMPYYSIPEDMLNDHDRLVEMTRRSISILK